MKYDIATISAFILLVDRQPYWVRFKGMSRGRRG